MSLSPLKAASLLCRLAAACICLCLVAPVFAKPTFPPIVLQTYKLKAGGTDANAANQCTLCHANAGPPDLNPFGKDVKLALSSAHAQTITPAILHTLDTHDSDGDGFTNGEELAADTLPGDPASKPAGTPEQARAKVAANSSATPSGEGTGREAGSGPAIMRLLFPKHAQHPVLIHFPIGLFIIALLFDFIGAYRKQPAFNNAAYFNLVVAALGAIAAVATGLIAWQLAFGGAALTGNLLIHLILSSLFTVIALTLWAIRVRQPGGPGASPQALYWTLAIVGFLLLVATGHFGGVLSGVDAP